MAGLSTLFRRNPYRDQMQTTERMIDRSGMARPFMMKALGEQTRQAGQYDEEGAATLENLYREESERAGEKDLREDADKVIKAAADLAAKDPIAATQYYNDRAKGNKHLPKGLKFRRSLDGKSLMEIKDAKGSVRGVINATDMFRAAEELEQRSGQPLGEQERADLAQQFFYPVPGYEKPKEGDEKKDLFQSWKVSFREEHGREPNRKELEEWHRSQSAGGEGAGRVKSGDTKALKIELARKLAPKAIKLLEAKGAAATPKELQAIKTIKAALSNVDPLTKDFNPDSIYAALAEAGEEHAAEFNEALLEAEQVYAKNGRVAGAVNDAVNAWHKRQREKKPPAPAPAGAGGKDWKKYLRKK